MEILERVFTLSERARRSLTHSAAPIWSTPTRSSVAQPKWHSAILDSLSDARELMDRLENSGRTLRELRILDDARFEVRWRDPYSIPVGDPR